MAKRTKKIKPEKEMVFDPLPKEMAKKEPIKLIDWKKATVETAPPVVVENPTIISHNARPEIKKTVSEQQSPMPVKKQEPVVIKRTEISALLMKHHPAIIGVVDVGTGNGVNVAEFSDFGIPHFYCIDPYMSSNVKRNHQNSNAVAANFVGIISLHYHEKYGSALVPSGIRTQIPGVVIKQLNPQKTNKISCLPIKPTLYNCLNIDVNGYELEVLKGAERMLSNYKYIFIRSYLHEGMYVKQSSVQSVDQWLFAHGLKMVDSIMSGIERVAYYAR